MVTSFGGFEWLWWLWVVVSRVVMGGYEWLWVFMSGYVWL